jgi:hypothetical protein
VDPLEPPRQGLQILELRHLSRRELLGHTHDPVAGFVENHVSDSSI